METGNPPNQGRTDQEEAERRIRRLNAIGFTWSLLPGGTTTEVDDEEENSNRETYSSPSSEKQKEDDGELGKNEKGGGKDEKE